MQIMKGTKSQPTKKPKAAPAETEAATLPDLVRPGLDVIFIGINPSTYSVLQGHYFARRTNRFWPAFSKSKISVEARLGLGVECLEPQHDALLLEYGFGFTDAVKRASVRATDVSPKEFAESVAALVEKLKEARPKLACFHGIMAYRAVHRVLTGTKDEPLLGLQPMQIGATRLFLAPNPSGANAHFTPADQVEWYDRLAAALYKG